MNLKLQFKFLGQVYQHTLSIWLLGNPVPCKDKDNMFLPKTFLFLSRNFPVYSFHDEADCSRYQNYCLQKYIYICFIFVGKDFLLQLYSLYYLFIWIIYHTIRSRLVIESCNGKELKGTKGIYSLWRFGINRGIKSPIVSLFQLNKDLYVLTPPFSKKLLFQN